MRSNKKITKSKYTVLLITAFLVLSTILLSNKLTQSINYSNPSAAACDSSLYPRCKDGTCSGGYKCGQDEKGGCKCIPVSSGTCNIQGFKVLMPGNQNVTPASNQIVTLAGGSSISENPYFFTNISSGSRTVSVSVPNGYSVGYTVCTNNIYCHQNTPVESSSWSGDCPKDGYVDLWWHFTPLTTPTPTQPLSPTPIPTEAPVDNTGYIPRVLTAEEQIINEQASSLFNLLPVSGSTFLIDFDYLNDKYLAKLFGKTSRSDFDTWISNMEMADIPTEYFTFNDPPVNPGDANDDNITDGKDFIIWITNYASPAHDGISNGDFYTDGAIDIKDYPIWISSY